MRKKNSIKNISVSMITNVITILIGFVMQTIFIKVLGSEYLGLNGLFNNIISMLSITELGISTAIIYNLYKPLVDNDQEKIKSLMKLYKKCYLVISFVVLIIGLIIMYNLNLIVKETSIENINIIFLLFLIDSVFSYLLSYKRSILIADQKNYIINIIHILYLVFLNIIQISILILTKNYYLFLIAKIIFRILENIFINIIVNKKYKYLKEQANELDEYTKNDIFTKIKALLFHKIGSFIVLGTDNILISRFFGLVMVGLYSNYNLIIYSLTSLFNQGFSSITSSIGNLFVTSDNKKSYEVFKKIKFINSYISIFTATAIYIIMDSFIKIWVGTKYILPTSILLVLVINYYLQVQRNSYSTFKEAAGIFYEDRFVPIIESIVNIICSIIFAKIFGLIGIFLGTICSNLVLHLYSYYKFVYKKIFNKNYIEYMKQKLYYLIIFIFTLTITYLFKNLFNNSLIINIIITITIPNIILFSIFHKQIKNLTKELKSI